MVLWFRSLRRQAFWPESEPKFRVVFIPFSALNKFVEADILLHLKPEGFQSLEPKQKSSAPQD